MRTRNSALAFAAVVLAAGCQTEGVDDLSLAFVSSMHVDDDARPDGNGSPGRPFDNLPDAIDQARGLGGGVRIMIAPGVYELTETLAIDFPVILLGANDMEDDGSGWPSGQVAPDTETVILSAAALGTNDLVKVGSETGPVIEGQVAFRNLTFDLGPNFAHALHIVKAQDFAVTGCIFRGEDANIGIFPVASSGLIAYNHLSVGAGISVNAGTPGSPAVVEVRRNRGRGNSFGGLLLNGSGWDLPETDADQLDVVVTDNDWSDNHAEGMRFGIRVFLIRRDSGRPGDDQDTGNVTALIENNRIVGNDLGMSIDAGFPFRNFGGDPPTSCDERVYHGSFDLELSGNELSGSFVAPALISFSRHITYGDPSQLESWQFLHDTTYTISDPDSSLAGFLLDHPGQDPFTGGLCPGDDVRETLANQLVYNGVPVPNSSR
jgi:hypothetical protein